MRRGNLKLLYLVLMLYPCGSLGVLLILLNFKEEFKKLMQLESHSVALSEQMVAALLTSPQNISLVKQPHPASTQGNLSILPLDHSWDRFISYLNASQSQLPRFMSHGTLFPRSPTSQNPVRLWPEDHDHTNNDRIVDQLMYILDDPLSDGQNLSDAPLQAGRRYIQEKASTGRWSINGDKNNSHMNTSSKKRSRPDADRLKTILLYGFGRATGGRETFLEEKCPVNACELLKNRRNPVKSDVVVFNNFFMEQLKVTHRPSHQLWVIYMLESPTHTQDFAGLNLFNMTATYRHDSDIVTPYGKWISYRETNANSLPPRIINYAKGKTKAVAWFVSNCDANNNRLEFARALGKYIQVDIYGQCGTHSCFRRTPRKCFDLLSKHYKFYLAFENTNCRDYITEKFFVNGLANNVLPIVMGAHPNDYKRVAPEKSYIHVDDFPSPKKLAEYLHKLDRNDELYNEYFRWKGTGEFINTHFFCRLCAMAHYADKVMRKGRPYDDFDTWWRGPNVCTEGSWRNKPDIFAPDYYE